MATITLITGGARSGKSTQALKLAVTHRRKFFVATGQALDDEMTARIEFHRETRPSEFQTVEEPVNIVPALEKLAAGALREAKKLKATYCDIRIVRYRR